MTTKKQLRIQLSSTERRLGATEAERDNALIDKQTVEEKLSEEEKLTTHQREAIRSLTEKLETAESEINDLQSKLYGAEKEVNRQRLVINDLHIETDCTRCDYIDENGKKLRPQKCATCRRGAKDNYTERPVACFHNNNVSFDGGANIIRDDFLKKFGSGENPVPDVSATCNGPSSDNGSFDP